MAQKKLHKVSTKEQSIRFDVERTINYWLEGADYDIDVAEAMYEKGKYPYALFMGHLAIEKLLKALVVKNTGEHAPFSHSLPFLFEKTGLKISQKVAKSLARFMEFHFEARYPDEQKKFYKKCTETFTGRRMEEVKGVYSWLKKRL